MPTARRTLVILALASLSCSRSSTESKAAPTPDPAARTVLQALGSSIAARDYASAYELVATDQRGALTRAEFEEAFRHYREGLPDQVKVEHSLDPYDREAAVLVPEGARDRIVAEGVVHFTADGHEGFSAVVWILMEAGQPKLAHVYVED